MRRLLLLVGCGSLQACADRCATTTSDCDAAYTPEFEVIHTRTVVTSCALSGCHSGDEPAAGMRLSDIDEAYEELTRRLDDDDDSCTTLLWRVDTEDERFVMPPGKPLTEGERCAIRQWIADGAPR